MSDPKHPTNPTWELYDPEVRPPPRGKSLLLLNEGETLIIGTWYDGALAWGYKPTIPQTVKDRLNKQRVPQKPELISAEMLQGIKQFNRAALRALIVENCQASVTNT